MTPFPPMAWTEYQRHRREIAAMLDPRCYTIEWLDNELLNQRALSFGNEAAVIVVTWKLYPAGASELHGLVAAGELDAILPLVTEAEEWARAHGFTFACIASRKGWSRVLKVSGYHEHQIELRKELN